MQHAMKQWNLSQEMITLGTMIAVPLVMLAVGLVLGVRGLMLLSFTVGPAIGWVLGVMLMGVIDRKTHPAEHEKDPY